MMATLSMSHETLTLWSLLVLRLGTPDGLNKLGFWPGGAPTL